jgi:hypothetical protein
VSRAHQTNVEFAKALRLAMLSVFYSVIAKNPTSKKDDQRPSRLKMQDSCETFSIERKFYTPKAKFAK